MSCRGAGHNWTRLFFLSARPVHGAQEEPTIVKPRGLAGKGLDDIPARPGSGMLVFHTPWAGSQFCQRRTSRRRRGSGLRSSAQHLPDILRPCRGWQCLAPFAGGSVDSADDGWLQRHGVHAMVGGYRLKKGDRLTRVAEPPHFLPRCQPTNPPYHHDLRLARTPSQSHSIKQDRASSTCPETRGCRAWYDELPACARTAWGR
ncbi:hypothetical protein B0T11DRAFT_272021 [Plectosphaerella cucumerina]|uniref:Uncharacterized protein n=1 Tax=Plectosphaerella cucumerina TaxID=40658 RepID=A0A8K0XAE8_9PEZI|nr:hypothetical protein B0T11DRAFT_272021 [Plectosphaerella cucumerina]